MQLDEMVLNSRVEMFHVSPQLYRWIVHSLCQVIAVSIDLLI